MLESSLKESWFVHTVKSLAETGRVASRLKPWWVASSRSLIVVLFFFSSRRRHTRFDCDWSSDVCSSDLSPRRTERSAVHADRDGDPLVSVPDRDLRHAGDLRDFFLGARLVAEDSGDVDRRCGHATRRHTGSEFVLLDLVEDLLRLPLHVHVELEPIAEPGDVIPRALREKLQSEFSDQGPIRPSDRLAVHARLRGDFVEGPRDAGLPARRVQRRRDDLVDRASPDEVLRRGPPIEYGGVLAHVAGPYHLRRHGAVLREAHR